MRKIALLLVVGATLAGVGAWSAQAGSSGAQLDSKAELVTQFTLRVGFAVRCANESGFASAFVGVSQGEGVGAVDGVSQLVPVVCDGKRHEYTANPFAEPVTAGFGPGKAVAAVSCLDCGFEARVEGLKIVG